MPPADAPAPDMGEEEPGAELSGKVKEIADIAGEISEKDQETALAYLRSLKDASEESSEVPQDGGAPVDAQPVPPVQESVVFTKKQIREINEGLEGLENELDRNRDEEVGRSTKTNNKPASPFDPPKTIKK